MPRKYIAPLVIGLIVLVVVGILVPRLIEWFVGGALAGGAALVSAQKRRRKANTDHKRNIAAETSEVEDLQKESDKLVEEADMRAASDPQDAVKGLSPEERRARLEEAARKLK